MTGKMAIIEDTRRVEEMVSAIAFDAIYEMRTELCNMRVEKVDHEVISNGVNATKIYVQ